MATTKTPEETAAMPIRKAVPESPDEPGVKVVLASLPEVPVFTILRANTWNHGYFISAEMAARAVVLAQESVRSGLIPFQFWTSTRKFIQVGRVSSLVLEKDEVRATVKFYDPDYRRKLSRRWEAGACYSMCFSYDPRQPVPVDAESGRLVIESVYVVFCATSSSK